MSETNDDIEDLLPGLGDPARGLPHANPVQPGTTHKCPICGKPATPGDNAFPFCSARCRQIDLGKWISGDYKFTRELNAQDLDEE